MCLGRAFVLSVGEDVLLDAGVTPEDLANGRDVDDLGIAQTEAMTRSYLEAASRCVDAKAYAVGLFVEESGIRTRRRLASTNGSASIWLAGS